MRSTFLAALAVATTAAAGEPVKQQRELMHTTVTVAIADQLPDAGLAKAFDAAFAVFADIDESMNEWKSGSALGLINAQAGGAPVPAPPNLCAVLKLSLDGARRTNGLFDPTWAALRGLWKFGDGEPHAVPAEDDIKRVCALIDYRQVELTVDPKKRDGSCTVRLKKPGMKLGLGGVVKGWGVDRAAAALRALGVKNFFIQAGGDLYFGGQNAGRPWRAGIRDPRGPPEKSFALLEVQDRAFSTSGDYEHFFVENGVRYHHIIDPRTCRPAPASRSVTVLAKSGTEAEFLTKAAFIAGGNDGIALAERLGAAAVIVDSANEVHLSRALAPRIELSPPSPGTDSGASMP